MRHLRTIAIRHNIGSIFLIVAALAVPVLRAQPGSIVANPDAVKLKLFWATEGAEHGDWLGVGLAALPDLDGDGRAEFLVTSAPRGKSSTTRLYYGDSVRPRLADWMYDSSNASQTCVGRFLGDGKQYLVLRAGSVRLELHMLALEAGGISQEPSLIWYDNRSDSPTHHAHLADYAAVDLDGDGADELVCFIYGVDGEPRHSAVWIYRGGVDFQLDTPTVEIIDRSANNEGDIAGAVGDLDGDGQLDLITGQPYSGRGNVLNIWFGDGTLPIDRAPDRGISAPFTRWTLVDVDGDGVRDVLADKWIFRSAAGKSARTRPFDIEDVDVQLYSPNYYCHVFGPLNNRSGRFDMVGPEAYDAIKGVQLQAFSGGPSGPNASIDAFLFGRDHGFLGDVTSNRRGGLGDFNGDGWSDYLGGNPFYYDPGVDKGIVVIIAGGPYIPVDDPSMGVREVVTGERPRALFVWPNPVRDHLNIAWRGDLMRSPSRFAIVDTRGVEIASGEVGPEAGAAIWRCGDVAAGAYVLRVLDEQGHTIGVTTIRKE
jgi:hypothetical protein